MLLQFTAVMYANVVIQFIFCHSSSVVAYLHKDIHLSNQWICYLLWFIFDNNDSNRVQALIVSPTRELASQTEKVILAIGDYINVQAHACIGGKSLGEDIRKLEYGVHVVSGTPGRVCDMIKRRTLRTRAIKLLILVSGKFLLSFVHS